MDKIATMSRTELEDALKAATSRFEEALQGTRNILYRLNVKQGGYDYLSPYFSELTGHPLASFKQTTIEQLPDFFHPDDRELIFGENGKLSQAISSRQGDRAFFLADYRLRKADGTYCWLRDQNTILFDEAGQMDSILGGAYDITEEKQAEEKLKASEETFSSLFATMAQGVVYQDALGRITVANPAAERILGLSLDQMTGRTSLDPRWQAIREDGTELPGTEHPAMVALRTGTAVRDVVMGIFHPEEGRHRWAIVNAIPEFRSGEPSPWRVYVTMADITDRVTAERALHESETRFRTLFETMQEGFALHEIVCDVAGAPVDYRFIDMNPAFERLTGLNRQLLVGRTVREAMPETEQHWIDAYGRVALTGEPLEIEDYSSELDRFYRVRAYSPGHGLFAVVFEDVTTEKKILQAIEQHQEQLRVLIESSHAGIIMVDPTGRITASNRRMAEMFGCSMDELIGSRYPDHVHPDHRDAGDERMKRLIAGEVDHIASERHYIRKDGSDFWGYITGRRQENAHGNPISLVGHIIDITDRKLAELALVESEERLRLALEAANQGVFDLNIQSGEAITNDQYAQMLGYDPATFRETNQKWIERLHPDDLDRAAEIYRRYINGEIPEYKVEFRQKTAAGDWKWILSTGRIFERDTKGEPLRMLGIHTDINDRKQADMERQNLERQLLHAQKLESLGVLAGGIAHDFNNILTAIVGNAELALMRLTPESPVVDNLKRIESAASRAADLAKQMLAYSGKGKFVVEAIDLNRLVEEMGHMLEVSISKKAILRYNLTKPLPSVEADATQLRQIVMNLVINASEAIGDTSGVIAISTGCMECSETYLKDAWFSDPIPEGLYVFVEIADTGCGMDRETLAKIFDPFFTTKFTGRGLGMAAVIGIIRGHKGAIKVYSEPGKGSSFKVLLPAGELPAELFNGDSGSDYWKGSGVALLVDDEETVRAIGAEMLRELGLEAVTANDGREAVEKFKERHDIRIVILDLTMPHMDGEQCFRELRMLDPEVRVIMSSGFSEHDVAQKFAGKGLAGFIQKPYKLSELRNLLRNILSSNSNSH